MPPRPTQEGGPPRGGRGRGRGGGRPPRGGPQIVGTGRGAQMAGAGVQPSGSQAAHAHVATVGVRRPNYGVSGKKVSVFTNACEASVPENIIYHYDAIEKTLPARVNMVLLKQLQLEPEFHPAGAYDGKKNLFMPHRIDFGGGANSRTYHIPMNGNHQQADRPPPVFKITITEAATINPEVLQRFIDGQQSQDETISTALTALNVVIRMLPLQTYPFNVRSFFTDREKIDVGDGLQLWRGYFQSLRPSPGRLLINIDLSTGMFFKPGPLINIALEVLNKNNPRLLSPGPDLGERSIKELERFLKGVRVSVDPATRGAPARTVVIQSLTREGAQGIFFNLQDGRSTNVAAYFRELSNRPLQFPTMICAKTAKGAVIPFERCTVLPGQLARKQVPPDVTRKMVEFSTKRPADRLASIRNSFQVLAYGQSEYVRNFGLAINEGTLPMSIEARQLPAPALLYGDGSKNKRAYVYRSRRTNISLSIRIEKKLVKPMTINRWVVVSFESDRRFPAPTLMQVVGQFITGCQSVGMTVVEREPIFTWESPQGNIAKALKDAGNKCAVKHKGKGPDMFLVILPDLANANIYRAVKHFGDITQGVVTQCLKSSKCTRAKEQYWANVCLKLNPKLGGVNVILDNSSASLLLDRANATIVMGADAPMSPLLHLSSAVSTANLVHYIPRMSVQRSRQEIIAGLYEMVSSIIKDYIDYQKNVEKKLPQDFKPKRLIFFRDGVSEGQFAEVKEKEVEILKKVCDDLKISPPPKITFLVVGKRHHYRYVFPSERKQQRRSGSLVVTVLLEPSSTKEFTHPLEFDWYLQSHGGLLGTSRSAHYTDNKFTADALQAICYGLCYIYARSTRSVSIPAPMPTLSVQRAKNHYDPRGVDLSDAGSTADTASLGVVYGGL
ncbi:Piwi-domain-containing protein [Gymnopus androsaceus JB14]|uniref:Piwi-domain-containing protein n=1 Tax=Gymnopus androsaceus JB14 TaxID=1447944 RepID=A0A6A4H4H3_9AGAR|nr:Piwi-domain-containing protein [Gymnopus androsaceus JB14]